MIIDASTKIQDLALQDSRIRETLEHLGIDTCRCGGKQVRDVTREMGLSLTEIRSALENALRRSLPALSLVRTWHKARTDEIVDFILQTYHASLRQKLSAVEALFHKADLAAKGRASLLISGVRHIFTALRTHLEQHLPQEEQLLFPRLRVLGTSRPPASFDTVRHVLERMEQEHETVGKALLDMRAATGGYILPQDASPVFASLYSGLRNLERDLQEHIFLENNVLFPKALRHTPQPVPGGFSG